MHIPILFNYMVYSHVYLSVVQAFAQQNQVWLYPARAAICHAALGDCIFYDKENKIPYGHNKLQERPLEHYASSG